MKGIALAYCGVRRGLWYGAVHTGTENGASRSQAPAAILQDDP